MNAPSSRNAIIAEPLLKSAQCSGRRKKSEEKESYRQQWTAPFTRSWPFLAVPGLWRMAGAWVRSKAG
jgi:hypothetical protein